jgi:hypothetical protein
VSLARVNEICRHGAPAARKEAYLQEQWNAHGNDFLKWWNRRPAPGGEVDIAQFYEMARTTTGVARDMLPAARVEPLAAARLQIPGESADEGFAAVMNVDLRGGVVYYELDEPFDIGAADIAGTRMLGALCWQLAGAGLNVIPFAIQDDHDGAFGHTPFDTTTASDAYSPAVAIHPGLTVVAHDGTIIMPVELDAGGICGSVVRAGNHMAFLIVGALWSLEADRAD